MNKSIAKKNQYTEKGQPGGLPANPSHPEKLVTKQISHKGAVGSTNALSSRHTHANSLVRTL
jgi:hypothetical protein